jgi:hypothetical protein
MRVILFNLGNDFYENKKQEIGNLLSLTKQSKLPNYKIKFWEGDNKKQTSSPIKSLKLSHNINHKFNEIDSKNSKRIVFNRTTEGWNKPNKYN